MRGANLLAFRVPPREQIRWGEAALGIARSLKDRSTEAILLSNLGMAYEDTGEHQRALDYQVMALQIAREIGARDIEETTLGNLGAAYWSLKQNNRALECYQQQLVIARQVGDRRGAAHAL